MIPFPPSTPPSKKEEEEMDCEICLNWYSLPSLYRVSILGEKCFVCEKCQPLVEKFKFLGEC